MNTIKEFMLEEYKQIANAYQDLHTQHNELIKTFLTLIAFPATILAVALEITKQLQLSDDPSKLERVVNNLSFPVILVLLAVLFLIGVAILSAYVATRAEAVLYVRTVNRVRRFFVDYSEVKNINKYLVLPDYDSMPPFKENKYTRSFWNAKVIIIINTTIFVIVISSLLNIFFESNEWLFWSLLILTSFLTLLFQCLWENRILKKHEENYIVEFPNSSQNLCTIGIDLDGVLGDLLSNVIKFSEDMFDIKIKKESITTHDLTKCTQLKESQVKELFQNNEIFSTLPTMNGAKKCLQLLKLNGFKIHVVSDRSWSTDDWKITKKWLDENNFDYHSLCLVSAKYKIEYAEKHELGYFIEDNIETAITLSKYCKNVFLFDTKYNQGDIPDSVLRFKNWDEIIDKLSLLKIKHSKKVLS